MLYINISLHVSNVVIKAEDAKILQILLKTKWVAEKYKVSFGLLAHLIL